MTDPIFEQQVADYVSPKKQRIGNKANIRQNNYDTCGSARLYQRGNAQQNVSDAIIREQIDILNNDFRRMNADRKNTILQS